jgi:nitrate reductase gamma subunit
MNTVYQIVAGPLAWASWAIFGLGIVYKVYQYVTMARKYDAMVLRHLSGYFGLRSILKWLVPYLAQSWRKDPLLTAVAFLFHTCLFLAPILFFAHLMLLDRAIGFSLPALPNVLVDIMTLVVIACCVYFLIRRLAIPEVNYVTQTSDWVLLGLVALPFITGFFAYHQILNYDLFIILHILSSEALLIIIPFTRLFHMILGLASRAYAGSEFGGVRHARDW